MAFALTGLLACGSEPTAPPVPESIDPARGSTDRAVNATIHGHDFLVSATVSYRDRGHSQIRSTFKALLGDIPLEQVSRVDDQTLTALIPPGLPVGVHTLAVVGPEGRNGELAAAYEVVDHTLFDSDGDGVVDALDVCPGFDDHADADSDGVADGCDRCAGFDDQVDADDDGVADGCDLCPGFDDRLDADADGVPNGCDACPGFNDHADADSDTVPDGCDLCAGFDDHVDTDGDTVPNGCDLCPGFDDRLDADADGVPNGCDACPGFNDHADADSDTVPDGCDLCAGFDDHVDTDGDTVPNGCDLCPGFDDRLDADSDGIPDGCDSCNNTHTPAWFDSAWSFRRPLTVTETAAGSLPVDYSVVITLDTTTYVTAGTMLLSANDLRIVWHGGSTPVDLDRRVVAFNTTTTTVWFKTRAAITNSDANYYLYYGNPAAGAAPAHWADHMGAGSTPSGVYLAGDDFEGDAVGTMPSGWEGSADYKTGLDGSNQVLDINDANTDADYLFGGSYAWTDVVVQARFAELTTAGTYNGLWLRATGPTNFQSMFYGLPANNTSLVVYTPCTITSPTATSMSGGSAVKTFTIGNAGTAWHDFEVRMLGQTLDFYWDTSLLGNYTIPSGLTSGRIGMCAGYTANHLQFDDVVVRKYVSPEPTAAAGAAQPYCL